MHIFSLDTLHRTIKKTNRSIVKRNHKFNSSCARQSLFLITHQLFPVL